MFNEDYRRAQNEASAARKRGDDLLARTIMHDARAKFFEDYITSLMSDRNKLTELVRLSSNESHDLERYQLNLNKVRWRLQDIDDETVSRKDILILLDNIHLQSGTTKSSLDFYDTVWKNDL